MQDTKKIIRLREKFEKVLDDELTFVHSLPYLRKKTRGREYNIARSRLEKLCEMSFLVLFVAWEEFLENSFENYIVLGSKYKLPIKISVQIKDLDTAHEVIRGGRRYTEWSEPQEIKNRATIFFKDGEPYETALGSAMIHLRRIRVVRNRIAHSSRFSAKKFLKMIRELYGTGIKITPGRFLLETPPPSLLVTHIGLGYNSMFEFFSDVFRTVSIKIAP